jgi:hypothetical protein
MILTAERTELEGAMAYMVVHPLDDAPEEKIDTERLGQCR